MVDKRNYADVLIGRYIPQSPSKLNFAVSIIFLFAAAYVHCLRFLPGQLTPIKKHASKTLKLIIRRARSTSRLDSSLLKRDEIGGES